MGFWEIYALVAVINFMAIGWICIAEGKVTLHGLAVSFVPVINAICLFIGACLVVLFVVQEGADVIIWKREY